MSPDWDIALRIVGFFAPAMVGAVVTHFVEHRPRLIAFWAHTGAVMLGNQNPPLQVNTHSVTLRNIGWRFCTNVRVTHLTLPDFSVFPNVQFSVVPMPQGGSQIVFPAIVPKQQVTIHYLYFPPLFANQIHQGVIYDQGLAREVRVLPTPQPPGWALALVSFLVFLGASALTYIVYLAFHAWLR